MSFTIEIDNDKIKNKITNDKLGLFVSNGWKRLIDPYTPRDTGALMGALGQTVNIKPWKLHYKEPYASTVYYGHYMKFQHKNPYSTYAWDVKAEQAGQLNKLYKSVNNALKSGIL